MLLFGESAKTEYFSKAIPQFARIDNKFNIPVTAITILWKLEIIVNLPDEAIEMFNNENCDKEKPLV